MHRIIQKDNKFYVQEKTFIFWKMCYIYCPDYSRKIAGYNSYEEALWYWELKGLLEDA